MRILQTCAGGISAKSLTEEFRKYAEVVTGDMREGEADIVLPSASDENYAAMMDDIAEKNHIDAIYPHNDIEAARISAYAYTNKPSWKCLLPSPATIVCTQNKYNFYNQLQALGYACDFRLVEDDDIFDHNFDAEKIYKPLGGCGSGGIIKGKEKAYLRCEVLRGQEFTVDMLCYRGEIVDFCVRKRLKSHGGICIDAEIVQNEEVASVARLVVAWFALHGPVALQVFDDGKHRDATGKDYHRFCVTDCNHRFGGGAMMSVLAGWRGVENYFRLLTSKVIIDSEIKPCRIKRHYAETIMNA